MVSRNWVRGICGFGVINEMFEDEDVEDYGGIFCLGELVELVVIMENKVEVKWIVSEKFIRVRN